MLSLSSPRRLVDYIGQIEATMGREGAGFEARPRLQLKNVSLPLTVFHSV